MNSHVPLEIASSLGREFALRAFERLFTTMDEHVNFQIAGMFAALVASVKLVSIIYRVLEIFCKLNFLDLHPFQLRCRWWCESLGRNGDKPN